MGNKLKIAVCLIGISFMDTGKRRNWELCYKNILNTFKNVDYYLTTYGSDKQLLKVYAPKKYQFLDFKTSTQRKTYIKALQQVEDPDFIITTRFDIHFHKKLSEMNLDYDKFNFLFKEKNTWDQYNFVTDNFFAFPAKYKQNFINAIKALDKSGLEKPFMHHIFTPLSKTVDYNFISPDKQEFSDKNSFYTLIRS